MSEEQKQPKQTDAVLGGTTQPFRGAVLGGVHRNSFLVMIIHT